MASINLPNFPEFELHPRETAPTRFDKYIKRLKNMFEAMNITKDSQKKAMLLHYVGKETCDILETLNIPKQAKVPTSSKSVSRLWQSTLSRRNVSIIMFMYFGNRPRRQVRTLINFTLVYNCLPENVNFLIKTLK